MMEILCIFSEIEKQVTDVFVIHVESKLSKDVDDFIKDRHKSIL